MAFVVGYPTRMGNAQLTGFCHQSRFRVRSSPDISFRDSLACLALGPYRPVVSPVLCGLRLTCLTYLTCSKGICRFCGVLVLFWCFVFVAFSVVCLVFFFWFVCGFVSCFPLLLVHSAQTAVSRAKNPITSPNLRPAQLSTKVTPAEKCDHMFEKCVCLVC